MFQDRVNLLAGHAWKPLEEKLHRRATLQVLEQGPNRDSRALESPCSTHPVGSSLHGVAPTPIEHGQNLSPIIRRHKNTAPLLLSGPARRAAAMTDVRGHAPPCGHYLPEEAPDETLAKLTGFSLDT